MSVPYTIGITGGSGSGKTHFLKQLMASIGPDYITLFSQDNYYLPYNLQPQDEKGFRNFDTPHSLDQEKFVRDLKRLKAGESFELEEYNFNFRDEPKKIIEVKPAPIIIVEGLFTFYFPGISGELDLKIFIETPDYLMLTRRIIRDAKERGYNDLEDTLYRYQHHVMPAFDRYIKPLKVEADFIIPNHDNFDNAVKVLSYFMKSRL
ncbi:MAG: uridine kinase [Cyclobacteriaceae bacterium]|nr:uridine kinase [Cyclobacteriaceae bacterium HetDA_MAG_MS6]